MTDKLLCESLEEFRLLREADEGDGAIKGAAKGIQKAVMTAPGRLVRKQRAKKVMKKYKEKMLQKSDALMTKYFTGFNQFVTKVNAKIDMINKQSAEDAVKIKQKDELAETVEEHLTKMLENMRNGIENIVKVYSTNFQNRIERKGTLTGVEFMPEEKTSLEADWKVIEENINHHVQEKTIDLLDNADLDKLASIKAALEEEVDNFRIEHREWLGTSSSEEPSDEKKIKDSNQLAAYDDLKEAFNLEFGKNSFKLDKSYNIKKPIIFPDNGKNNFKIVQFQINNDEGKIGYKFFKLDKSGISEIPINNKYYYIRRNGESQPDVDKRIGNIIKSLK